MSQQRDDVCSDDQLQSLLHSDELDNDFLLAAEHLESCTRCQSRLPELAADHEHWKQAKRFLVVDEETARIDRERADRTRGHGLHQQPKTWTNAMAKELLAPPSHPEMLGRVGRYEIERLIGSGGMGVVFKGFDSELNRPVAVKLLAPHLAGSGAARQRFAREARAAAAIVHEHVVAIHNVESESEPPLLVMQYVAGESLQSRLDRLGPLGTCELLRIARQTAAALAAAHAQGLVHRDVKPSNILLEEGVDRALLTDFGLARASDDASLTHSGHALGTPHYMSPEQARGEHVNQLSDLFSLGSVMYAMSTGRPPFRAETSMGVLRRITDTRPRPIVEVNPEIPLWLCGMVERLHAPLPEDRFGSAAEVAELLAQCLAHMQQPDVQPLPSQVLARAASGNVAWRLFAAGESGILRGLLSKRWLAIPAVLVIVALLVLPRALNRQHDTTGPSTSKPAAHETRSAGAGVPKQDKIVGPPSAADSTPDPATDWDSAGDSVLDLTAEIDHWLLRQQRPWDDIPTFEPRTNEHLESAVPTPH